MSTIFSQTRAVAVPFEVAQKAAKIALSVSNKAALYFNAAESVWYLDIAVSDPAEADNIKEEVQKRLFEEKEKVKSAPTGDKRGRSSGTRAGQLAKQGSYDGTPESAWDALFCMFDPSLSFSLLRCVKLHGVPKSEAQRKTLLKLLISTVESGAEGVLPVHYEDLCQYAPKFARAYPMKVLSSLASQGGVDGRAFKDSLKKSVELGYLSEEEGLAIEYAFI